MGFDMKARKLPSGRWQAEGVYRDESGHRIRKSFTSDSRKAAEAAALEFEYSHRANDSRTVLDALQEYVDLKTPVLSPSTIRAYKAYTTQLQNLFPAFCRIRVDDLTPRHVQRVVNALSKDHSPKSVRNYFGLLTAAIQDDRGLFSSVSLPAKVRPNYSIPTSEGVQRLLAAARDHDLEIPVLLAAVCTMRRSEICALRLEDIEGNKIHVRRGRVQNSNNDWVDKNPKTYSSDRIIDAPPWLCEKIRAQGYVTRLNPQQISNRFSRMVHDPDLGLPICRFHDLRHYSASLMHSENVPTVYIMQRGGWKSETVLNEIYRHALDDYKKAESEKVNGKFSELFS